MAQEYVCFVISSSARHPVRLKEQPINSHDAHYLAEANFVVVDLDTFILTVDYHTAREYYRMLRGCIIGWWEIRVGYPTCPFVP